MKLNISAFKPYDKDEGYHFCFYHEEYLKIGVNHNNPKDGGYILWVSDNDDFVMNKFYASYEDVMIDFMSLLKVPNIQVRSLKALGLEV